MTEDKKIMCARHGCYKMIVWTVDEQRTYKTRGWQAPRYCTEHRLQRKEEKKEKDRIFRERRDRGMGPRLPGWENDKNLV